MVNPDGSGRVTLALGNSPAWARDGKKLVYTDLQCSSDYSLGYPCFGGLGLFDPETRSFSYLGGTTDAADPAWSKTDDVIVFWREPGVLITYDPVDGKPSVPLAIAGVAGAFQPAWSPDGQRIAFACRIPPRVLDLCTVDKNGADLQRWTNAGGSRYEPAWSPDGRTIAFVTDNEIDLITLNDGTVTRLTDGFDPAWSPDGAKLVFVGSNGLFTINADGSNRTRLTTGPHHAPAWRP